LFLSSPSVILLGFSSKLNFINSSRDSNIRSLYVTLN
jgi:hypothetical protein